MRLTDRIHFDAAPAAVFAMLTDRRFQERVCTASGATEHQVTVEERAGGGATVTTRRVLPTTGMPDFVRSFAGQRLTITQRTTWSAVAADDGSTGTTEVEIAGAPVRLSARIGLAAEGAATVEDVAGDLTASVPLLGGRIERAAEPAVRSALRIEAEVGRDWLRER